MKTAIYVEDGVVQLVLTPESKFEKDALTTFTDKPLKIEVFNGSFYDCRGGWVRQRSYIQSLNGHGNDNSLILTIRENEETVLGDSDMSE